MVVSLNKKPDSSPFELKGSLFTLTVLYLQQTQLEAIDRYLVEKISQAPSFFHNVPVIIELERLDEGAEVDFSKLYDLLRNRGMIPVAVRNGSEHLVRAATAAGLPLLPASRAPLDADKDSTKPGPVANLHESKDTDPAARAETAAPRHYRLYSQPVRSGQQVYAPHGDLILLGPVSPGAEVLADGNIHSYAPLRGRALAGARGDVKARIFCQALEAELVAVAGNYKVIEKKDEEIWGKCVQIYLADDERLLIAPLARSDNRLGG